VVPKVNGGAPVGAESIATRVVTPVVAPTPVPVDDDTDLEPRRSRVGMAIFIVGLIVLILGAGSYALYRMLQPPPPQVQRVTVPSVLTYTEEQAQNRLDEVPLKMTVVHVNDPDGTTKGTIIKQDPLGGVEADANSTVQVTVNDGPKTAKIPSGLKGKDVDAVKAALAKAKFTNVVAEPAESDPITAKANEVISVDPSEGTSVPLDQEIRVTYASGKSPAPLMIGKTPALAEAEARQAGFTKFTQITEESEETAGVVFDQTPKAGIVVSRGTTITYKVAIPRSTPPPSSTPSNPPSGGASSASPSGGQSSRGG
jgi:beta-lactam-binding protein with PASTA domain